MFARGACLGAFLAQLPGKATSDCWDPRAEPLLYINIFIWGSKFLQISPHLSSTWGRGGQNLPVRDPSICRDPQDGGHGGGGRPDFTPTRRQLRLARAPSLMVVCVYLMRWGAASSGGSAAELGWGAAARAPPRPLAARPPCPRVPHAASRSPCPRQGQSHDPPKVLPRPGLYLRTTCTGVLASPSQGAGPRGAVRDGAWGSSRATGSTARPSRPCDVLASTETCFFFFSSFPSICTN